MPPEVSTMPVPAPSPLVSTVSIMTTPGHEETGVPDTWLLAVCDHGPKPPDDPLPLDDPLPVDPLPVDPLPVEPDPEDPVDGLLLGMRTEGAAPETVT